MSRETLENPKILQHDLNRNENTYDYVCQIGSLVVAFQQNMSEMKSQQLKLASTIEVSNLHYQVAVTE